MYDVVIVGCGLAGSVLARLFAEEKNKKVLILERRKHIGGNIYDFTDRYGIKVQKYGPHVFHTNSDEIFGFISKWCTPVPYITKCEAVIEGISTPSPFNLKTIEQFYEASKAEALKRKLKMTYGQRETVTIMELMKAKDLLIREYAEFLFQKDYKPYTAKQWNLAPEAIDISVLERVPVVLTYRDTYFNDKYEFIPQDGFTEMINKILKHKNISVHLHQDALKDLVLSDEKVYYKGQETVVIYTGAIDELFGYKMGRLPYRALRFEYKYFPMLSYQNTAIVAYPQEEGYTRVTEYTKLPYQRMGKITLAAFEYPEIYSSGINEPYYPVLTQDSKKTYLQYRNYAKRYKNLYLCGRLADFKYYNMDQVVARAFNVFKSII